MGGRGATSSSNVTNSNNRLSGFNKENGAGVTERFNNTSFKTNGGYLVMNPYGVMKINDKSGTKAMDSESANTAQRYYEEFSKNYTTERTVNSKELEWYKPNSGMQTIANINEDYAMRKSLYNGIKKAIKPNSIRLLKEKNGNRTVIEISNTKTKEIAYLLPVRRNKD